MSSFQQSRDLGKKKQNKNTRIYYSQERGILKSIRGETRPRELLLLSTGLVKLSELWLKCSVLAEWAFLWYNRRINLYLGFEVGNIILL